MDLNMTQHGSARQQQRGLSPLILDWLTQFGATAYDHHGAEIRFFDKRSRKQLATAVGNEVVSRLEGLLDIYAVVSTTGSVITVGHRYKRIREH